MMNIVYFEGVLSKVRQVNFKFLAIAIFAVASLTFTGCSGTATSPGTVGAGDAAAKVNGKEIKMEAVEKVIKAQAQGQESRLSQLELTQARLQVLQQLIQQEVMYQKAEAEKTVPTDDVVNAKFNEMKTQSGKSAEAIQKEMETAGETEASFKENIKKRIAIEELEKKVTSKIDAPKDSEITAFYEGNKEVFVNKRGVKLAAIVVDPANNGEGDTTTDQQSAVLKGNEILKQLQGGADFATLAREKSEDQSRVQSGELGYITEEQMKATFPAQTVAALMDPKTPIGQIFPTPLEGKFYIMKLQQRNMNDENLTLESPGVREKITETLTNSRKELLANSYTAIAMNEAKIENYLAKKVVENPNELSGARPAGANSPAANTAANTTANTATANSNAGAATAAKPAAPAPANTNTNTK